MKGEGGSGEGKRVFGGRFFDFRFSGHLWRTQIACWQLSVGLSVCSFVCLSVFLSAVGGLNLLYGSCGTIKML